MAYNLDFHSGCFHSIPDYKSYDLNWHWRQFFLACYSIDMHSNDLLVLVALWPLAIHQFNRFTRIKRYNDDCQVILLRQIHTHHILHKWISAVKPVSFCSAVAFCIRQITTIAILNRLNENEAVFCCSPDIHIWTSNETQRHIFYFNNNNNDSDTEINASTQQSNDITVCTKENMHANTQTHIK